MADRLNEKKAGEALPAAVIVGGLTIIRCLGISKYSIPLFLATSEANKSAFYSKYVSCSQKIPGPTSYPEEFIDSLCRIGESFGSVRPALFYDGDADLLCVSRNRERLSKYYEFLLPDADVVEQLLDKSLFREFSVGSELPVPASYVLTANNELTDLPESLKYPLIIKPVSRVGWFLTEAHKLSGGGKAIRINSEKQLKELLNKCKETGSEMLIQQLVPGGEENIVSYHSYVNADGELLAEHCGRKIRTYPLHYGLSSCIQICDLPDVKKLGREVLNKTGLVGVSKMDFKIDSETGEIYLLEINPRFSIWNYAAAVAGLNLPLIAYKDVCNLEAQVFVQDETTPVRWVDGALDYRALQQESGSILIASWKALINLSVRTVYSAWSWKDPKPLFYELIVYAKDRLKKAGSILIDLLNRTIRRVSRLHG